MEWTLPWQGACLCGAVRVRVTTPPLATIACHCKGCQKMSGSAFSTGIVLAPDGFHVDAGRTTLGGLHRPSEQHHCPTCLGWLYTLPEGPHGPVVIRATLLDDVGWYRPFVETCTTEKLPWAVTGAEIAYPGFPPPEDLPMLLARFSERFRPLS